MKQQSDILKGLHPGIFLKRELTKRKMRSGSFALSIGEHPQTMSAIIHGQRSMKTALSLRIEQALGLKEGFLMTLQVYHDIAEEKRKQNESVHPDLTKFRKSLFWDTSFREIDWVNHRSFVVFRVFERGNTQEILETIRFYGRDNILPCLDDLQKSPFADTIRENMKQYLSHERN